MQELRHLNQVLYCCENCPIVALLLAPLLLAPLVRRQEMTSLLLWVPGFLCQAELWSSATRKMWVWCLELHASKTASHRTYNKEELLSFSFISIWSATSLAQTLITLPVIRFSWSRAKNGAACLIC